MEVKIDKPIVTVQGDPVKHKDGRDMTVKTAMIDALTAEVVGRDLNGEDKYNCWKIVKGLMAEETCVHLDFAAASCIRRAVGMVWPALVVGQVYDALEV